MTLAGGPSLLVRQGPQPLSTCYCHLGPSSSSLWPQLRQSKCFQTQPRVLGVRRTQGPWLRALAAPGRQGGHEVRRRLPSLPQREQRTTPGGRTWPRRRLCKGDTGLPSTGRTPNPGLVGLAYCCTFFSPLSCLQNWGEVSINRKMTRSRSWLCSSPLLCGLRGAPRLCVWDSPV